MYAKSLLMDGAMGTELMRLKFPPHENFEVLNLSSPRTIEGIHRAYKKAGAEVIVSNTFGANRPRLSHHDLEGKLEAINEAGIRLARKAAGKSLVFASIGPLGLDPKRTSSWSLRKHFREQILALEKGNGKETPDGYLIETMTSLKEALAAIQALRTITKKTAVLLMAAIPPLEKASVLTLKKYSLTLRKAGASVLGVNCGPGPAACEKILKKWMRVDPGPFATRPSAGLRTYMAPSQFAIWSKRFRKMGCTFIGGCCGTTPAHLKSIPLC